MTRKTPNNAVKQPAWPEKVNDQGTCTFGAGVLLGHVQALEAEVEGVHSGHVDIEYIHRARVASRRLRAALPLFIGCLPEKKSRQWLKEIRKVTRALGEARDADVQIERLEQVEKDLSAPRYRAGVLRLLLRLKQRRARLQKPVSKAMERLTESGVLPAMHERLAPIAEQAELIYIYTPDLYRHSFNAITARLEAFLAFDAIVPQPEKVTELHEMRIAAKWLRYTMETFAPLYGINLKPYIKAVKDAQEHLGEIHDADVWIAFLPQFLLEEHKRTVQYYGHDLPFRRMVAGIRYFEQERKLARAAQYEQFFREWEGCKAEGLWDDLHRTIQTPFLHPENMYPPPEPDEEEISSEPEGGEPHS